MTVVTAATVRRELFEPSLEGHAANLEQAFLLANDTPEIDCLADVLLPLVKIAPGVAQQAFKYLQKIVDSNRAEGSTLKAIVRTSDALATDLRRLELNDPTYEALTARGIARAVRDALTVYSTPGEYTPAEFVAAVRAIDTVIDRAPAVMLFAPRVRKELRERKFRLLADMYESRTGLTAPVEVPA